MEGRGSAAGHLAVLAMVLVLVMAPGALAANHLVGGSRQWDYAPASNLTYYTDSWAANQIFAVGDTLQFTYTASEHDVVQLNSSVDYNACSGAAVKTYTSGNDTVPLPIAGTYYYICSVPGHCTLGMKVSVTVGAVPPASPPTTGTPPPTTTPSPPTTPSPSTSPGGNGASSGPVLSMAGLLIATLVASLAFLV